MPNKAKGVTAYAGVAGMLSVLLAGAAAWGQGTTTDPAVGTDAAVAAPYVSPLKMDQTRDEGVYRQHVLLLSDPFMEGRGPGTKGNRIAADYLQFHFQRLGLKPPFEAGAEAGEGETGAGTGEKGAGTSAGMETSEFPAARSYFQEFKAGTEATSSDASLELIAPNSTAPTTLRAGRDFTVLGFSAEAAIENAELVFVGYSLEKSAKEGVKYSTYGGTDAPTDLTGKVAVMFRFEPMDEQGKSLWADPKLGSGWTSSASLGPKLQAAARRGAAGIIVINTPGADDPRVEKLETTAGSANWSRRLDIPVVMVTPSAAEVLTKIADDEHRSVMEMRRLADTLGTDGGPAIGAGVVPMGAAKITLKAKMERKPRITWNVGGMLPGKGTLADEVVVIGAHFDHVGYGYTGGSRTSELGVIHPGADDNASGTSGMLLCADLLSRYYKTLPADAEARSVLFLGFSAEEMGLIGSRHFVKNSPIEAAKLYAMLNMDMIGRYHTTKSAAEDEGAADESREFDPEELTEHGGGVELGGVGTAEGLRAIVSSVFDPTGLRLRYSSGGRGPSDHASFYSAGVPVLFVFTGLHEEYHTPRDVSNLINVPDAVRIAHGVANVALALAEREGELKFTSTDRRRSTDRAQDPHASPHGTVTPSKEGAAASGTGTLGTGMGGVKVRFGIAPGNYAEDEEGVLVGEVYPNTSAAIAGIHPGDRLMKWNGEEIGDVAAWMEILGRHKPGDVVEVTVKRKRNADGSEGGTEAISVTLKARESMDQ